MFYERWSFLRQLCCEWITSFWMFKWQGLIGGYAFQVCGADRKEVRATLPWDKNMVAILISVLLGCWRKERTADKSIDDKSLYFYWLYIILKWFIFTVGNGSLLMLFGSCCRYLASDHVFLLTQLRFHIVIKLIMQSLSYWHGMTLWFTKSTRRVIEMRKKTSIVKRV